MKLIAFLGNPGKEYASTRHNAGFMAADYLVAHAGFDPFAKAERHHALMTEGVIGGEKVMLLKPMTFMNLSGQSIQSALHFFKLNLDDLVVIHDEVDVPLGTMRIRPTGSAGGHNGIKSVIQSLGSQEFKRIRIGIQPEKPFPGKLEDFVLGRITEDERVSLNEVIEKIPSALEVLLKEGITAAMNKFSA